MMRGFTFLIFLMIASHSYAQSPVLTVPQPTTTSGRNASSTIVNTGTFQLLFSASAASSLRTGCTIINLNSAGGNNMYVTEGLSIAGSTQSKAVPLAPQQAYYCQWNGIVLTGEIDITGTTGDSFYAAQY